MVITKPGVLIQSPLRGDKPSGRWNVTGGLTSTARPGCCFVMIERKPMPLDGRPAAEGGEGALGIISG
jgi:hypothetical protein